MRPTVKRLDPEYSIETVARTRESDENSETRGLVGMKGFRVSLRRH